MMRDEGDAHVTTMAAPDADDGGDAERRRDFRRTLPFGRGAVLMVGERAHIVGVADVSISGAFLSTRAEVSVGDTHVLKLLLMPERVELRVHAEVVRTAQSENESDHHPRGVAVRFVGLDDSAQRCLRVYVSREPKVRPA